MVFNAGTKTLMPQYHDDSWSLDVRVGEKIGNIEISEESYNKLKIGDRIRVTYGNGRLLNSSIYIKSIMI